MVLFNDLKNESLKGEFNVSYTENGAKGFKTSGKELVDFNFSVPAMRRMSEEEIQGKFLKIWNECPELALKMIFFVRDAREGMGERRTGRTCLLKLGELNKDSLIKNLSLIPEYGRWDDLTALIGIDTDINEEILRIFKSQLDEDLIAFEKGEPVSLLAKWLPSENASSKQTKQEAKFIREYLGLSAKEYRQILSKLRKHLKVVETFMCAKEWGKINYESVPSIANLRYRNCFLKNDEERRREFLGALQKGKATINASVATPVDIVHNYGGWYSIREKTIDSTLEAMWKALPDVEINNTLVVVDGSGSMTVPVTQNGITAMNVANSIGIYCSERNTGFENQFITFSRNPQLVDLSNCNSLLEKLQLMREYTEVANTNIEKTFKLILDTAISNGYTQEQMPKRILIISDMEFDYGVDIGAGDSQLFTEIGKSFNEHGYKLPKLIFWNVNSRTGTIPVRENDLGVGLVSGFSEQILKMVISDKLDPFEIIVEQLMSERYSPITL